jgi:hypothetical protein
LRKEGVGGRGIATRYQVTVPDLESTETVTEPGTVTDSETVTDPVTVSGSKRCPDRAGNGVRSGHTLQSNHRKAEAKATPPAAPAAESFPEPPDWIAREAWDGFVAMRKRERHPLTARAAVLIISELNRMRERGHDPTAVLDTSTRNGWRDVYAPKQEGNRHGPTRNPSAVERVEAAIRERRARGETTDPTAAFG